MITRSGRDRSDGRGLPRRGRRQLDAPWHPATRAAHAHGGGGGERVESAPPGGGRRRSERGRHEREAGAGIGGCGVARRVGRGASGVQLVLRALEPYG